MSRKAFTTLLLVCTGALLHAQMLRIEPGFDFLQIRQQGTVYTPTPGTSPVYYLPAGVDRFITQAGLQLNVFYPLNFGTGSFEKFAYGPESGITIYRSHRNQSVDPQYQFKPDGTKIKGPGIVRIPVMVSIRFGNQKNVPETKWGLSMSAGAQLLHFKTADEAGWGFLPGGKIQVQRKALCFGISYYFTRYKSYYVLDGAEMIRLSNTLLGYHFSYAIDWYSRKTYKPRKIPRDKPWWQ